MKLMLFSRKTFLIGLCGSALVSPIHAEDWTEFRGPTKDGISTATGLPTEWSVDKNVVWKAELPGKAWSSPIAIGDRVYVTNAVAGAGTASTTFSLRLTALEAGTGKVIWDKELFSADNPQAQGAHGKNSFASPTPIFENGLIYAHFGHLGTACVDVNGNILWKTTELNYAPVHGNGGCPVIVDDLLIFTADAAANPFIAALDKKTGKVQWKVARESDAKNTFSFSTPLLIEVNGVKQVVTAGSNVISGLNPNDGSEIWRVNYEGYSVVPRPIFAQGLIFMSTGYNKASVLAIKPDGKGNVTDTHIVWKLSKGAPLTPSLLMVGKDLYMVADNGMVSSVDAKSGEPKWQERVGRATSASPIYADGKIYFQDEMGVGYVIKPGSSLELLAKNDLGEKSLASYAVSGKNLLIRTEHALWCIGEN